MINPAALLEDLFSRGAKLGSPARAETIDEFQVALGYPIDHYIKSVFTAFDGFMDDDFDERSFVSVWPIAKIISNLDRNRLPLVCFADGSLSAVVFEVDMSSHDNPVTERSTGELIAENYTEFWQNLLADQYEY